jgi:hypothetical protein
MGKFLAVIRSVLACFKTEPGTPARLAFRLGYTCGALFWIYQFLPRWDWVVALHEPSGALLIVLIATLIAHIVHAADRWNDRREAALAKREAVLAHERAEAERLRTDQAMITALEPMIQAAVLHFVDHPAALLWLETNDEGVRRLVRRGYLQALQQNALGIGSYELTTTAETWLKNSALVSAVESLRTNPQVQTAQTLLDRRQAEIQRKLAHSPPTAQRAPRQEIDLVLGEGLRDLAARYSPETLVIQRFQQWAVVHSVEEARKLLADLEAEIRATRGSV